jgi:hypothetical protein
MEIQPSMVGTMMVNRVTLEVHAPWSCGCIRSFSSCIVFHSSLLCNMRVHITSLIIWQFGLFSYSRTINNCKKIRYIIKI